MPGDDTKVKEVEGEKSTPETESWLEYSVKMQQEAPTRFEEAAKFLATIISLSLTILFASLYRLTLDEETKTKLALLLCALIGALLLAFMVMFPMRYKYSSKSVDQIKEATKASVRFKQRFFIISVGLYLLSLLSLICFYF